MFGQRKLIFLLWENATNWLLEQLKALFHEIFNLRFFSPSGLQYTIDSFGYERQLNLKFELPLVVKRTVPSRTTSFLARASSSSLGANSSQFPEPAFLSSQIQFSSVPRASPPYIPKPTILRSQSRVVIKKPA